MSRPDGLTTPFSPAETEALLDTFHREGFVVIPGVLSQAECAALRRLTDESVADPAFAE